MGALALAMLGHAPGASAAVEKSIWGPDKFPVGHPDCPAGPTPCSAFPLYRQLGVDVYQFQLPWSQVAPTRPQNARNPNAARLYMEYLLSEGQDVIIARGEYALRNGAPSPSGLPPLAEVKLMPIDVGKALAEQKKLIAWWQGVTGIQ